METKQLIVSDIQKDRAALQTAAELLRRGGLVAIPTETVYGLAANALDPKAASAIYQAKGRPSDNPLIVHVSDVQEIAILAKEIPPVLLKLAEHFWPGPMTVILEKSDKVPCETTGGLDTVAVRIPAHPVARALIAECGLPLAAPSANRSGYPSPTSAAHCMHDLNGRIDAVLDGGPCEIGIESTVLTLCSSPARILRPGAVTLEMLREVIPDIEMDPAVFAELKKEQQAISPGMKYRHYAPNAKVVLVHGSLDQFLAYLKQCGDAAGVICFEEDAASLPYPQITYGTQSDAASQAHYLFDALRKADENGWSKVYIRTQEKQGIGAAVYNRLLRASGFEEVSL